jgi:hypothetical protein
VDVTVGADLRSAHSTVLYRHNVCHSGKVCRGHDTERTTSVGGEIASGAEVNCRAAAAAAMISQQRRSARPSKSMLTAQQADTELGSNASQEATHRADCDRSAAYQRQRVGAGATADSCASAAEAAPSRHAQLRPCSCKPSVVADAAVATGSQRHFQCLRPTGRVGRCVL